VKNINLNKLFSRESVVVIDGGLSTQLEVQGCRLGSSLWTGQVLLDDPELIEAAHMAYLDAGVGVLITSSYQLSRQGFSALGLSSDQADNALSESVDVAKRARGDGDVLVAASVGPYGAVLHDGSEYEGNYGLSVDELVAFHAERLEVLVDAEPDLLAIETIPDAVEASALVQALKNFPYARGWMSFTLGPDGKLWAGQTLTEAVQIALSSPQIIAVGVNCLDPELVASALKEMRDLTDLPLVVYANGGGTWNAEAGVWEDSSSKHVSEYVELWAEYGPALIGGCCGTQVADIARVAAQIKK
jgi:homocysteine S-methyltransferase